LPEDNFVYFYHPDHLGSTSFATAATGELYEHLEYFPFGETWVSEQTNTQRLPNLFTGKELDEETQLYYFGARYYDPRTSVWQSTDPILDRYFAGEPNRGVYTPANLALYTYAWNNPVLFHDPDGRFVFLLPVAFILGEAAIDALLVGGVFAAVGLNIYIYQSKQADNPTVLNQEIVKDPGANTEVDPKPAGTTDNPAKDGTKNPGTTAAQPGLKGARLEPADLQEQLTQEEAKTGAGRVFGGKLNDGKYDAQTGTETKMEHNHNHGDGTSTEVHYDVNRTTGERGTPKIKDDTNTRSRGHLYPQLKTD
jgi:RHS repeat-associated protein